MASYKLSPDLPGSDESHKIRSSIEHLQNLPIQEALTLSKQRATRQNIFYPQKYGAKKLGAGAYGTVYLVRMTNEIYWELASLFQYGGGKIITQFPHVPTLVVIKITKQKSNASDSEFYKENVRENVVHKRLYTAKCLQVGTKPLCISKYVPKFFMSCIIGKPKDHRSLTIMDPAGNTDLSKFVRGQSIPVALFVEIERAICAMWLTGYIHGDLHRENIMLDTNMMAVKIIDFGFALKLPPPFVAVLGRRIYNKIGRGDVDSLGDIWTQKPVDGKRRLINYTNGVMKSKGFPWYNPDYKILQTLWNQVPRKLRSQIPAARSSAWGIPIGELKSRPQSSRQSPTLHASFAKTYRSSETTPRDSKQKSVKEEMKNAESAKKREEMRRAESARRRKEMRSAESAKKREEMRRAAKRTKLASQKEPSTKKTSPRTPSPVSTLRQPSPYMKQMLPIPGTFFTPSSRKFTNTERAVAYGQKNSQKMFSEIERQKMICRQRGMFYNPLIKQCSYKTLGKEFSGCRIDCARIGRKCGPRGKCVKL